MTKFFKSSFVKIIFLVGICFLSNCKESDNKIDSDKNKTINKDSLTANQRWMQAINNRDLTAIKQLYAEDIYGLSPNGIDFSSRDTLLSIVKNNSFVVKDVQTIKRIEASTTYDYEIGSFKNASDGLMKYVVIWDTSQETDIRVLEFLDFAPDTKVNLEEIDEQRAEWIRLCNAHNAAELINKVYTYNTMYYNHRPMVVGRENLIPVYRYMNNEAYELKLEPIIIEPVSGSMVYEIGQCKGSYNGKYILIWQKTAEGWQVLFDANL